jgi:hypothetical protein
MVVPAEETRHQTKVSGRKPTIDFAPYFSHAESVDYNRRRPQFVPNRWLSNGQSIVAAIVRVSTMQSKFSRTSRTVLAGVLFLMPITVQSTLHHGERSGFNLHPNARRIIVDVVPL